VDATLSGDIAVSDKVAEIVEVLESASSGQVVSKETVMPGVRGLLCNRDSRYLLKLEAIIG
jgi:hypothetical protein